MPELPQIHPGRTASGPSFSLNSAAQTVPALLGAKYRGSQKKAEATKVAVVRVPKRKHVKRAASFMNLATLSHVPREVVIDQARRLVVLRCITEGIVFSSLAFGASIARDAITQIRQRHKDNSKTVDPVDLNDGGCLKVKHVVVVKTQLTTVTGLSFLDYEAE